MNTKKMKQIISRVVLGLVFTTVLIFLLASLIWGTAGLCRSVGLLRGLGTVVGMVLFVLVFVWALREGVQ